MRVDYRERNKAGSKKLATLPYFGLLLAIDPRNLGTLLVVIWSNQSVFDFFQHHEM